MFDVIKKKLSVLGGTPNKLKDIIFEVRRPKWLENQTV